MTTYINIKTSLGVETVDEFESYREAKAVCNEYIMADSSNYYYLSSRCTSDWRLKK